jgi:hypothetical protein
MAESWRRRVDEDQWRHCRTHVDSPPNEIGVIGSGELEQKAVAITAAVAGPERGRCGLQELRDSLSAVRATVVGEEPIAKGPGLECQVAALVRALVEAVASTQNSKA